MNIRDRWVLAKTQLAEQLHRLAQLLDAEADGTDDRTGHWIVAGQRVNTALVIAALGSTHLVPHGEGNFCVSNHRGSWAMLAKDSPVDFWVSCCVNSHCPLTLNEADDLLAKLQSVTPERAHLYLDTALVEDRM